MKKDKNSPNQTMLKISYAIIGISFAFVVLSFVIPIGFIISVYTFNSIPAFRIASSILTIGGILAFTGIAIQLYEYRIKNLKQSI